MATRRKDSPARHTPGANEPAGAVLQDWGRVFTIRPRLYVQPRTDAEMREFLADLLRGCWRPQSLRVIGSLHSCAEICASDAILDLSLLPKAMDFSPDSSAVTASANVRLQELLEAAATRGRSLNATGGTDGQALAGLIATNTAPATSQRTIYDLLEWVEYLTTDPAGTSLVVKTAQRNEPAFNAVVCNLGAIGILTRVRFGLIEQEYYQTVQRVCPLNEVLGDLDATAKLYDFWRINWIQETDKGLLWAANRIPKDQADPRGDYGPDFAEKVLEFLAKLIRKSGHPGPLLTESMRVVIRLLAKAFKETTKTGPMRTMLPVDRHTMMHVAMAEWSFDPQDLPRVLEVCRGYFGANEWPNLPTEIELTKTDPHFMSPWNWPGLPYIVKFNFQYLTDACQEPQKPLVARHLRGLWDALLGAKIPFKAHWGKINFMDPAFVQRNYQRAAFDPFIRPLFLNPYLTERL